MRAELQRTRTLSEFESKQMLAAAGVPVVPERLASTPAEAAAAAVTLGFPVAVKLCGPGIAHKTERGLVRLGLGDAGAVRAAAAELLQAARPEETGAAILVSRMIRGQRELIAGGVLDSTFGRCVMLGIGGVFAETLADVVFRLVPITRVDAEEMIMDLQYRQWLGSFRGEPPVDQERLIAVLLALSRLLSTDERIVSVDINPLVVSGGAPVAADALIEAAVE